MSNIQPYIIINGVNSRTISGLLITSLPPISKPQQRTQVETVDGRSGDIITPLGFSAYDKTVSIGLTYNYDIDEIIEFFNTSGTVIFSNEPTKYYRFAIYEQIDFEKLIKFKTAEVVLHVQPYKFSTTEEPLLFNDPTEISVENNGNTDARPNLLITGSGEIDVSLNGSQLLSMDLGEDDQTVIIDSENMNAYGAQSAIREVVANIEPKQTGSGDPSPDNIREISGYSELNLTRCGINLMRVDSRVSQTTASVTYTSDDNYIYLNGVKNGGGYADMSNLTMTLPRGTYYLKAFAISGTASNTVELYAYNGVNNITGSLLTGEKTLTLTELTTFRFRFAIWSDGTVCTNYKIGIVISTASISEYSEYTANTYTVNFGQTVYGGVLDVTNGTLTVTHKGFDMGSQAWTYNSAYGVFYTQVADKKPNDTNAICDIYGRTTVWFTDPLWPSLNYVFNSTENNQYFYVRDTDYTDANAFKTAMSEHYLVYELATPITYQLTPTQINNLLGLNNLYSNTGSLSVKYKSGGVIQTQTGDIVTFTVGVGDMDKGTLLNRLITGDYDKIRLKKGENVIKFTGNVKQVSIDKYSRWI